MMTKLQRYLIIQAVVDFVVNEDGATPGWREAEAESMKPSRVDHCR